MLYEIAVNLPVDATALGMTLLVALALKAFPQLWTLVVGPNERNRIHSMDGARGVLTCLVLSQHMLITSAMDTRGVWHPPTGGTGALMVSGFFVAPFFMLTGMLFGGRLIASSSNFQTVPFVIKRFFRLMPAYTLTVGLLLLGAMITSGFHLHVSSLHLVKELARWMMLDFVRHYDINGVDMVRAYGVLWTLHYEVMFYALLPIIAVAQRRLHYRLLPIPAMFLLGIFIWPFVFFGAGALAYVCSQRISAPRPRRWCQVAAVLGLIVIRVAAEFGIVNHLLQALCLVPMLVCIAVEARLVRFLRWRPLRLIGEISYSNYVLHGAALYILGAALFPMPAILQLPLGSKIAALAGIGFIALTCALICFVLIERPFIKIGTLVANRFAERLSSTKRDANQRLRQTA